MWDLHYSAQTDSNQETQFPVEPPLTRREYFAAMAMQGILSGELPRSLTVSGEKDPEKWKLLMVMMATEMADALIVELSK